MNRYSTSGAVNGVIVLDVIGTMSGAVKGLIDFVKLIHTVKCGGKLIFWKNIFNIKNCQER